MFEQMRSAMYEQTRPTKQPFWNRPLPPLVLLVVFAALFAAYWYPSTLFIKAIEAPRTSVLGTWGSLVDESLLTLHGDGTWARSDSGISDSGRFTGNGKSVVLTSDNLRFEGAVMKAELDGGDLVIRFVMPDGTVSRGTWYYASADHDARPDARTTGPRSVRLVLEPQVPSMTASETVRCRAVWLDRAWSSGFGISSIAESGAGGVALDVSGPGTTTADAPAVLARSGGLSVIEWDSVPASLRAAWERYLTDPTAPMPSSTVPSGTVKTIVDPSEVVFATARLDRQTHTWLLHVSIDDRGTAALGDWQRTHPGERVGFLFDGSVIDFGRYSRPIGRGGVLTVRAPFAEAELNRFLGAIESGPLPRAMNIKVPAVP